jgi:peptide/nickel transport system permease protein
VRAYLARRLLLLVPTLIGVTVVTFGVVRLTPGDPALAAAGGALRASSVTREAVEHFRREMGLDQPLPVQYGRWLSRVVRLDLGTSWSTGRSVAEQIGERLPVTLGLGAAALLLVCLVGIPLGALAAAHRGSTADRVTTVILFLLYSAPSFWVGTLAIVFLGGGHYLDVIPVQGLHSSDAEQLPALARLADLAWHAAVPVLLLAYAMVAGMSRYVRTGLLEVLRQDFVRTARAKGLPEGVVVFKHALRSALVPVLSHLSVLVPALIGGSVVVERIFGIPGMGNLMFEAILARDYSLIMGIVTVSALLTVAVLIVTDVLYAVADPRISYGSA